MPVLISPTGVQAVHPDGEIAAARAAASRGVAYGLSSFAGKAIEDVIAANPQTLFQTYWAGGREAIVDRIERAKTAGAVGLILTTDWSFSHARDWGSPSIPQRIDLPTMLRQFPAVLTKPRWLTRWARAGLRPPGLEVPNFVALGVPAPRFFDAYGEWMQTPPPTWDDVAWLVEQWNGPLMLKGVMRVEDAKRAIDAGVTAISVSNHGGNNLDGSPAPVRVLQSIAEAVGHRVEVLMDGGVRRGSDVVKAVALGARAVMIGRAALWGLAVAGQQGVENVLDVLRNGIDSALLGIGKASIAELAPGDLLIPAGFSPG
jgi:heme/flavin dehydrogenase (mycofactocin system)